MQLSLFTQRLSIITALVLGYSATWTPPSVAQTNKFFCGMSRGIPATFVRTSRGNIPIIRWVDTAFPKPWTPEARCEEISGRFQKFYNNGTLNFLRAGRLRKQPVLCVASQRGGPCLPNGVLVTLQPNRNPQDTLQLLLDYRGYIGTRPLELSGSGNNQLISSVNGAAYLNLEKFLTEVESPQPENTSCPPGQPVWNC